MVLFKTLKGNSLSWADDRLVLLDCAHNPAAARALVRRLSPDGGWALLLGCLADKDASGMVGALCSGLGPIYLARYRVTRRRVDARGTQRALPAEELVRIAELSAPGRGVAAGDIVVGEAHDG